MNGGEKSPKETFAGFLHFIYFSYALLIDLRKDKKINGGEKSPKETFAGFLHFIYFSYARLIDLRKDKK